MSHLQSMSWATQTTKPLTTMKVLNRLEEEAKQLLQNVSEGEPSVGDAIFVEYETEFARKNKIGRFGRLTIKDGFREYHAGPAVIDRQERVEFQPRDFMAYAKSWVAGTSRLPPVDELVKDPPVPTLKSLWKSSIITYETELFHHLRASTEITLVNPAMSTMVALKVAGGGFVSLTSRVDEKWSYDIHDFVKKSEGKLKMLPPAITEGIAYLGTNLPLWYPPKHWIRTIINPFTDQSSYFQSIRVDLEDTKVKTVIRKKPGYEVHSILYRDAVGVIYNPETIDQLLKQKKRLLWLESDRHLHIPEVEENKFLHPPWFINYEGEWKELEGRQWLVKNDVVYDVESFGTYASKRSILPPSGHSWIRYSTMGTHMVQYNSLEPFEHYGLRVATLPVKKGNVKVALFDDLSVSSEPILKRKSGNDLVYNLTQGDLLQSEENIYRSHEQSSTALPYVYVDEHSYHYTEALKSDDGVLVSLGGEKYRIPFVPGEISKVTIFGNNRKIFQFPRNLPPGQYFAFPSSASISKNLHLLSLFTSKVRTIESFVEQRTDPEYGGLSTENNSQAIIEDILMKNTVTSIQDYATLAPVVARKVGFSISKSYHYLRRMARVWVLRDGNMSTMSFVHEKSLSIYFPGTPQLGRFDGKSWAEALDLISPTYNDTTRLAFSLAVNIQQFKSFLQLNLCSTRVSYEGTLQILIVRRGPV